ncbi:MAG: TonB-dependent receptor [Cytophagales bacterium]|nr:TonB-dependent receptor [Cytophagales bacterium]
MKFKLLSFIVMITKSIFYGTLIQTFVFSVLLAYNSDAQIIESVKDKELDLNLRNVSLKQAIIELERNTDYEFVFDRKILNSNIRVDLIGKNLTVYDYLLTLSKEGNLHFKQYNNSISVSENKSKEVIAPISVIFQSIEITGKVLSSEDGEGLPGVNVIEKGTSRGTVTDVEGNYFLNVIDENTVLVFSSVGFVSEEVTVGNKTVIDISLVPNLTALEEIVVVGYGTQSKANMTGAVSTVAPEELIKRPVTNTENLLQGKVTGLQVVQNSGQPGDDGARMRIRGMGTFDTNNGAGNDPMVVIDGIQGNLTDLDPNTIETVSVLKDAASAAIYGARAANGVILITTKKGKSGSLNLDYTGNFQLHEPTRQPELVTNSADYMELWNYANERAGLPHYFEQSDIDAFRNSNDPVKYPNYNWMNETINTAFAHNHHLSANGGNDKTRFDFSLGYSDQEGVLPGHDAQRYNLRLSMDSKINKVVDFGGIVQMVRRDIKEPIWTDGAIMLMIYGAGPNYTPYLSDGSGRFSARYNSAAWHNRNPVAQLEAGSKTRNNYSVAAQTYLNLNITEDLTWSTKGAINFNNNFYKHHEHTIDNYFFKDNTYAHDNWPGNLGVTDQNVQSSLATLYSTLTYSKTIAGKHNVNAMLGYNQESFVDRTLSGKRITFPVDYLAELNAGAADGQSTSGTSTEWAIQSFFGRVNYDFGGKYLVEASYRYDGTSRIHKDHRWGGFPSISAGWRISEELFLNRASWLDNLKLRASWGRLGNQNIGLYPYQNILSITAYPISNSLDQGVVSTRLTDETLTWETTTVTDIGLDYSMKKGLFSFSVDWYEKITDDILYQIQIPASVGLSAPTVNYAKMKNTGFEIELGHAHKVGEFAYDVNFNFSTYTNEVQRIVSPSYGNTTIQEGLPWQSYYLTEWIRIFQSQEEIDNGPTHQFNPKPGDLKFKDQNDDGQINGDDRVVVDGAHPDFYYGGGFNFSLKNFDFSAFFQGVQGQKHLVNLWGIDPFIQGAAPTKDLAENAWTPDNPTNEYPAMYAHGYGPVTGTMSTYYLKDASYFRLKNLVIGYNVPTEICSRIGMKSLRVYLSGDNLLTFTDYPGADPERLGSGWFVTYPQIRIYNAGINFRF